MGQANSRSSSSPPSLPQQQPSSSNPPPNPPPSPPSRGRTDSSATAASASSKSSRRLSLRRTVRSFLPHSRPSQDPSSADEQSASLRKRWRSSRRFSKSPAAAQDVPDDITDSASPRSLHDPIPEEMHVTADLSSGAPPVSQPPSLSSASVPHTSPSIDRNANPLSALDSLPFPIHSSHTDPPEPIHPTSSALPDHLLFRGDADRAEEIERELDDFLSDSNPKPFVEGSSRDGQSPRPIADAPLPTQTPGPDTVPEPQAQPPRHFQPPGPLVVVQGVVNTSDNAATPQAPSTSRPARPASLIHPTAMHPMSRPRSSSIPRTHLHTEERQSARSRLSAFIPRPSSMLNRHSSPSDADSVPSYGSGSSTDVSHERTSSDVGSSEEDSSDPSSDTDQGLSNDGDVRPRPLSPGSIDVLGTLLSVAAAATAASLFSPSLGFQANADNSGPPPSGIPRPMSPTPTAGLGGGQAFSSLPGFGLDPTMAPPPTAPLPHPTPQPREGRERIRNVWESFRERLGLNRNSVANTSEDSPSSSDEPGNMRPGEIMLAEMARALNIGLGLNGDGSGNTSATNPDTAPAPTNREAPQSTHNIPTARLLPPEDSFERFLLNLQADLRVALSEDGISALPSSTLPQEQDERDPDDTPSARLPLFDELPMRIADEDDDDDEPPPLEDLTDEEDEEDEHVTYEDTVSTRTPTPMPASSTVQPNRVDQGSQRAAPGDSQGNADRGPPGINLWRLYRFQPIPASQVAGHAASTTSPSIPLSPSVSTSPSPSAPHLDPPHPSPPGGSPHASSPVSASASPSSSSPRSADPGADGADSTPAATPSPPAAGDASSNMVVPVIVVGLQSVDMGQAAHGHAHLPESDAAPAPSDLHDDDRRSASASSDDGRYGDSLAALDGSAPGTTTPRGRSWQSRAARAASALRNLRPGRRGGSGGNRAAEGGGSRTFLIYVIGGYYPPNHHMVTGSDNLDSYEALWELAELLGQVKPPVATREDIDKSGLQIIKTSDLEEYERQGRVASNCIERCLICLDDYEGEDDLRLMSCKHAFHKECVDKWLQVGRNNCPACRSKGVFTAGETASP